MFTAESKLVIWKHLNQCCQNTFLSIIHEIDHPSFLDTNILIQNYSYSQLHKYKQPQETKCFWHLNTQQSTIHPQIALSNGTHLDHWMACNHFPRHYCCWDLLIFSITTHMPKPIICFIFFRFRIILNHIFIHSVKIGVINHIFFFTPSKLILLICYISLGFIFKFK